MYSSESPNCSDSEKIFLTSEDLDTLLEHSARAIQNLMKDNARLSAENLALDVENKRLNVLLAELSCAMVGRKLP